MSDNVVKLPTRAAVIGKRSTYRGYDLKSGTLDGLWVERVNGYKHFFVTEIEAMEAIDKWKRKEREDAARKEPKS